MLDLAAVDLALLCQALEDHSGYGAWFLDPESGDVLYWSHDADEACPEDAGALFVDPVPSREAYGDMEDFTASLGDGRAAELLGRALNGRGAFRRFKDTLFEFPELRDVWFRFHDVRMRRRAIVWLDGMQLIDPRAAAEALAALVDPLVPTASRTAADAVAAAVAERLKQLYGDRLRQVVLFGSRAREDAHPESDLDLIVVLDECSSPWEEMRRMDALLWQHTLESGMTVAALPVDARRWENPDRPVLVNARAEGRPAG
jgi:predicted nucleotidyltransferase